MVLHNNDLNQVTWEQRVLAGDPKFEASQVLPDFPYARYAELLGFEGIRVDAPGQLGGAWERAFAADRPVLLEAITDPNIPPLPPHITYKEAKGLASSLAKGDPDAWDVARNSFVGKMKEFFPVR
jgi:pyruvate dehydrogenase (quinone)